MIIKADTDLLKEFEQGLNPRCPEKSLIPARIVGYGEISTVFQLDYPGHGGLVFKRLPIFNDEKQVRHYEDIFKWYHKILSDEVGICIPEYDCAKIMTDDDRIVFYNVQQKFPKESICNHVIHILPDNDVKLLISMILTQLQKVWKFNKNNDDIKVGLDGQISNWAICDFDPQRPQISDGKEIVYLDTSTPLIRKNSVEMLDADLFLVSIPSFLKWTVKYFFLQEVLDRYYEFRLIVIDLIANLFKEGKADLIPMCIETANEFFSEQAREFRIEPIGLSEVSSYYKKDAFIWRLFLRLRKADRFIKTKILMGRYDFVLPEKIKR